jgi:hypothetical protein
MTSKIITEINRGMNMKLVITYSRVHYDFKSSRLFGAVEYSRGRRLLCRLPHKLPPQAAKSDFAR